MLAPIINPTYQCIFRILLCNIISTVVRVLITLIFHWKKTHLPQIYSEKVDL